MNQEFLKLIQVDFMHGVEEPWCNNQGVAILPYVLKDNQYYFLLLNNENNPLFKDKKISKYSTITGGLENLDPCQTVINEMLEEVGINVKNDESKIYYLGEHYANKSSTKLWYLFRIDLTEFSLDLTATYKGKGDGTEAEKGISAEFVSYEKIYKSNDALCLATYGKWSCKNEINKIKINKLSELANKELSDTFEININEINEENPESIIDYLPKEMWQEFLKLEEKLDQNIFNEQHKLNNYGMLISISSNLNEYLKLQASEFHHKNKITFPKSESIEFDNSSCPGISQLISISLEL